jgi:hypothetical protein
MKINLVLFSKDGFLVNFFFTICPFYDIYLIFNEIMNELNNYDK